MRNELAFRISQEVAPPEPVFLGRFLASPYDKIRVLAYCPFDAQGDVELSLVHIEGEGGPGYLDQFMLVPGSNVNLVYPVPGVILGVMAQATADATTSVTVWVWGHRTDGGTAPVPMLPPPPPPVQENPLDQFLPPEALALSGVSPTGFNPTAAVLTFTLTGASFGVTSLADTAVQVNGQDVPPERLAVAADSVAATGALQDGRNEIHLVSVDELGRPIDFRQHVWAGDNVLQVTVQNADGTPFTELAAVTVTPVDDQVVTAQAITNTGTADFANVPTTTVLAVATADGNRAGVVGAVGDAGAVAVTVLGFAAPSPIDNNDFSQGVDGWDVGAAPVQITAHQEEAGPAPDPARLRARTVPRPPAAARSGRNDEIKQALARLAEARDGLSAALGIVDNDLVVTTAGEGAQVVSRTFQTDPDVSAVRLRYRFVTSEVPGGYFGSQFNDYYFVSLRSQAGGGRIFDVNSMNGLGLGAFDAAGSSAWRDATLVVDVDGDTIQAEVGVANVADNLLDSQVIVDFVEEVRVRVVPALTWNDTQGGLDLRYTVEGDDLPEDRDIAASFANGPGFGNRIGPVLFTFAVPQGTAAGQYGPERIAGNLLANSPAGTTHIVAASTATGVGAIPDVRIAFGPNANAAAVSPAMLDVVEYGLRAAGQANATITSTARTPADQARAMFNNLTNPANPIAVNVANQLALYAPPGDAVINEFVNQTQGMTPQQIQQNAVNIRNAMEQEINNQGPQNVSRHCADPAQISVVDVSAGVFNANNAPLFMAAVDPPAHLIDERNTNNCFHLEL